MAGFGGLGETGSVRNYIDLMQIHTGDKPASHLLNNAVVIKAELHTGEKPYI